jgi:hypothetical protein
MWSALTNLAASLLRSWKEKGKPITKLAMKAAHKPFAFLKKLSY